MLCWGHTERYAMYAMYALYAMFAMFATPSGHIGCDLYETLNTQLLCIAGCTWLHGTTVHARPQLRFKI